MHNVSPRLILAPVRGITDAVYRQTFVRCFGGLDQAIAPYLQLRQGKGLRPGDLRQLAPENNRGLKTVPQILANHPATLRAALDELHRLGYDEVNWNLGCPYPMVTDRGRGAGLLPQPDRITAILEQVLNQCPVRLSVKLRLGHRDPDECLAILELLNRFPLSEVILHPRLATVTDDGPVDIERASRALALCRHPFVFNGGITTPAGFCELRNRLPGVAGWMIGRGVLTNPFLPILLKGGSLPDPVEYRRQLREFHRQLLEGYRTWLNGPAHLLAKMKEHWEYLALLFADAKVVLARIRHSHDAASYNVAAAWAFDQPLASA